VILIAGIAIGVSGNLLSNLQLARAADYDLAGSQAPVASFGPSFTYQGFLTSDGLPADGTFDFEFKLFNDPQAGVLLGLVIVEDVAVTKGYFTTLLNYLPDVFSGEALWLEISVRPGSSTGTFTKLDPRQAITPVPYANYASTVPWNGLKNIPAGFADGVDNDTTYSQGFGLNLSGNQFSVNTDAVQARVASICAPGSAIRAISANGSVTCDTGTPSEAAAPTFSRTPLDFIGNVGLYPSIAIGPDGMPFIAYLDGTNGSLKLAHCQNVNCRSATITTIDTNGTYPSTILGADNKILIVYGGANSIFSAHCEDAACNTITKTSLYISDGSLPSLKLGSDGLGLFSYFTVPGGDLKVAHCSNTSCSSVNTYTLDNTSNTTRTALIIGGDGLGLIAYTDGTPNYDLKIAHCADVGCTSATTNTLDTASNVDIYLSIGTSSDGFGLVVYNSTGGPSYPLKAVHCNNSACDAADITQLADDSQGWMMATKAPSGTTLVAYITAEGLKIVYCTNDSCSGKSIYILDRNDAYGVGIMDIEIGSDGLPVVAYTSKSQDLVLAHCDDIFCAP
jgi:hypothetical protein